MRTIKVFFSNKVFSEIEWMHSSSCEFPVSYDSVRVPFISSSVIFLFYKNEAAIDRRSTILWNLRVSINAWRSRFPLTACIRRGVDPVSAYVKFAWRCCTWMIANRRMVIADAVTCAYASTPASTVIAGNVTRHLKWHLEMTQRCMYTLKPTIQIQK